MSLKDAVTEIADQMEKDLTVEASLDPTAKAIIRGYARQLRVACKASDSPVHAAPVFNPATGGHELGIERAREEFRRRNAERGYDPSDIEDRHMGGDYVVLEGGDSDNVTVPYDPTMPDGAKMVVGGQVYFKVKGQKVLRFSREETDKLPKKVVTK